MFVLHVSSADLQVVEVVQRGAQSPACLHIIHFLRQLEEKNTKSTECRFVFIEIKRETDFSVQNFIRSC